jgi:hypothetical protein
MKDSLRTITLRNNVTLRLFIACYLIIDIFCMTIGSTGPSDKYFYSNYPLLSPIHVNI